MDPIEQFTRLWTQTQPVVASYIGSLVTDFHTAEDLLQNVAIQLQRKFAEYDPHRPFVAWALGFARLEVLNLQRTQARSFLSFHPEVVEAITSACEELTPELELRTGVLRECLKKVQGRAREALVLRYEEALSSREIAGKFSVGEVAIRVLLSRTRATLRECIERHLARTFGAA